MMDEGYRTSRVLRVLDMTRSVAGPWTTRMLADAGLEVVKVEPPPQGDFVRHLPSRLGEFDSGYFRQCNAGKRSLCIDLRSDEGNAILWRLIPSFDVIMHNMRPNAGRRLGLTSESVHAVNPRAIFVTISGYGSSDEFINRPGQDLAVQCVTGISELTGQEGGAPAVPIWSLVDTLTSAYAYVAICSALIARERRGVQGVSIEVIMSQCAALLHDVAPMLARRGLDLKRAGRFHPYLVLRGAVRCSDGFVAVSAFRRRDWMRLTQLLGRFQNCRTMEERFTRKEEIQHAVDEMLGTSSVRHALDCLADAGVPAYELPQSLAEVEESEIFQQRGMLVQCSDGALLAAGMLHRARSAEHLLSGSPRLGEATADVLIGLAGLSCSQVVDHVLSGAIACEPAVLEELLQADSRSERASAT